MPLPLDLPGRPEERVSRQLAAALLFEGLVDARVTPAGGGRSCFSWAAAEGTAFRCRGWLGPFGRPRLLPGSVEVRPAGALAWQAASPGALLDGVRAQAVNGPRLLAELERTIALCRWNAARLPPRGRRSLSHADLEGALDEGHPYHPCFKARLGFSNADHAAYGPEAGQAFRLRWLAVARSLLHQALPMAEEDFWRAELGAETWADLDRRRRAAAGGEAGGYGLLPLHPWQWDDLRGGGLAPWLADGRVHDLGQAGDRYRASQSLRTLINHDHPERADIKLPLGVINTAARRDLTAHSVCSGPAISAWLGAVVAGDPRFADRYPLALLPEYAGIIADRDGPLGGRVAALWRGSVAAALRPGEAAVPFNILAVTEADGRPFIADWLARHGLDRWLDRLLTVAVLPVWHLLVAHGIAVEAHGQNMVLVHRDGWPERLLLRDFHDSVEYEPGFVAAPERVPPFAAMNPLYRDAPPDTFYCAGSVEALRELVMDGLFIYNFSELSLLLECFHSYPEAGFWSRVAARLHTYAQVEGLGGRQARVGHAAPMVRTESLLREKLLDVSTELHHRVPNALAAGAPLLKRGCA